jgi:hypothetical protein
MYICRKRKGVNIEKGIERQRDKAASGFEIPKDEDIAVECCHQ